MGSSGTRACAATRDAFRSNAPRSTSTQARLFRLCIDPCFGGRIVFEPEEAMEDKTSLDDTLTLMRDLRARCEWDAAQTHESLRPYLIEEALEVDDAIRADDDVKLREELGDLLLQILFHSVLAEERHAFSMSDVAESFIKKMKGRHPHLYGEGEREPWEQMKARKRESIVDG